MIECRHPIAGSRGAAIGHHADRELRLVIDPTCRGAVGQRGGKAAFGDRIELGLDVIAYPNSCNQLNGGIK